MENGEPYRDIDLNLKKISEKLNISNAYISQVLNEYLGENFYTFVNRYRINLAKEMLEDSKKDYLTILAIAYDSGFKSKGTFNQTFKKITKMTPSAYRKKFNSK
jgi:AraC-like DNA-binding protein